MTKDDQKPAQPPRSAKKSEARSAKKSEARSAKKSEARSAALRANLLKRKQQTKTRADIGADTAKKKED